MRTVALPRDVAAAVVVSGLSSAMRTVAVIGSLLTTAMIVDVVSASGRLDGSIALMLTPAIAMGLLAALLLTVPSVRTASLYLIGGGIAASASVVALVALADVGSEPFLLNRVATALPLVGALAGSARSGVRWTLAGIAVAYASLVAGWLALGELGPVGYGPLIVGLIALSGFAFLASVRHRAKQRIPEFLAVQRAVLIDERERELQRRAAAAVHDTVLADLAAVSHAPGVISDRMRAHIVKDLDAIARPTEPRRAGRHADVAPAPLAQALLDLADGYRWNGVTVQVSGAEEVTAEVPATILDALVGATRAALDNVAAHAGTARAELVIGQRDDAIAVLVVDAGHGFDPAAVGSDRLGLRESIHGRMRAIGGSARVWSGDEGTTVMLRVPITPEAASSASAGAAAAPAAAPASPAEERDRG